MDGGAEWRLPPLGRDVRLGVTGLNLLERRHREFVGAPELGRLLITRPSISI